jgi:DNA protecting protein DprA
MDERSARMCLAAVVEPGHSAVAEAVAVHGAEQIWATLMAARQGMPLAERARALRPGELADRARSAGVRFVIPGDAEWPQGTTGLATCEPVNQLSGEPLGLWVAGGGDLAALTACSLAMVGSRASTAYGDTVASDLAAELSEAGRCVVSGGAYGIDAAAHRGGLAGRTPTIAVLAGGLDRPYPGGHRPLFERIAERGVLVTELAPGEHPTRVRFLARNRLIAAITPGTVLVEAAARSGARNTVTWANVRYSTHMPTSRPTRPAIFARISRDDGDTAAGVNRQVADGRALAKQLRWPAPKEYVDNNVSAWSGVPRPEYERLLADIESGYIDGVIVYHYDRLNRQARDFFHFLTIAQKAGISHNVKAVTGDADLTSAEGEFFAGLQALVAQKSSADASRRIRRQKADMAAAGLPSGGGRRPFGYTAGGMELEPSEANKVRTLAGRYLAGDSIRNLTAWLTTTTGRDWTPQVVRRIITSARIAGIREHNGAEVGPAAWPAIISADDHRRILSRAAERRSTRRRTVQSYLLTGLVRCGTCGAAMYSETKTQKNRRVRRYNCKNGPGFKGCGKRTITATALEELIASAVLEAIDTPELATELSRTPRDDTATHYEATRLHEQLEQLARDHGEGLISRTEWFAARQPLSRRLESLAEQITRASRTRPLAGITARGDALRDQWRTLTLARQAAICEAVIERIDVLPSPRPCRELNPNRIVITWRV